MIDPENSAIPDGAVGYPRDVIEINWLDSPVVNKCPKSSSAALRPATFRWMNPN